MNTEHAEIYRNLLCYIFKFSKPEDYIYHLFNFIKESVPAKSIICFNMERKKKLISIFVDYNLNVFSQYSYTCNVSDIIPWDYMYSLFNKNGDPIIYINDISKYPILEKHVSHMPINIKSCITLQLFIDKENERLHSCIVYSDETDVFTQEHVEFMSSLRPILKRISQSFFMEDVDEDFTISTMNRLPSSPETLLRRCPDMRDIMRRVEAVAPLPTTVLISGPSGSGKELVAETIHALSGRNKADRKSVV